MVEPQVAYFGEKTPESSDPNMTLYKQWLQQNDVLVVLVETIPNTLSLGKEIRMVIQLSFSIFLVQLDKIRDGKGGLLHVIVVTHSMVRRIVTFCSIHFVGGNGPTNEYPDPISAVASKEKVSLSVFLFIILFVI